MPKYISGGHIPEHAQYKAIVQEGNMVVTSTCGHAQSNIIRSQIYLSQLEERVAL